MYHNSDASNLELTTQTKCSPDYYAVADSRCTEHTNTLQCLIHKKCYYCCAESDLKQEQLKCESFFFTFDEKCTKHEDNRQCRIHTRCHQCCIDIKTRSSARPTLICQLDFYAPNDTKCTKHTFPLQCPIHNRCYYCCVENNPTGIAPPFKCQPHYFKKYYDCTFHTNTQQCTIHNNCYQCCAQTTNINPT